MTDSSTSFEDWATQLDRYGVNLRSSPRYRVRRIVEPTDATHVRWDGRDYVNFSSNNYLGLTHHPAVIAAVQAAAASSGAGSGAAGLISGYTPTHAQAEAAIGRWKGVEAAVLLPSGYQAAHAVVQATVAVAGGPSRVRFLLDKLMHASLLDAVRGSGAALRVFPHNHMGKLTRLLERAEAGQRQVVVTESIFSMDGDAAPLTELAAIRSRLGCLLLVDEAHASGVYGPAGSGLAAELGVQSSVDLSLITLSKALGNVGGAVCGSSAWAEAVINHGRSFIFSTSPPAAAAAGAAEAIRILAQEPERQQRVRELATRVRSALSQSGLEIPRGDSPIIPIVLGSENAAMAASRKLLEMGMLVVAVRPPTVAVGASRLRVTLSAAHTDGEVDRLITALQGLQRDAISPG